MCVSGPYHGQGLVHLHRVHSSWAQSLLLLLLLVLLHGLLDADLGPPTHTLLKRLQLVVKGVLVLLVCSLERERERKTNTRLNYERGDMIEMMS